MRIGIPTLAAVILLGLTSMRCEGVQGDLTWHDATEFQIEGQGWTELESPYDRLPAHAKGSVPESVWYLGKQSAGLCVRFRTNARSISLRWDLTSESLAMPHMPATGVSGVDLYCKSSGAWRFIQNGRPTQRLGNLTTAGLPSGSAPTECLVYLPLYNGVKRLEIGVPAGAKIERTAPRSAATQRPIAYYGTSIAQGGCASRPGMAHIAMLGRMLDRPMINLGFSGSGKMEPAVSRLLAELEPSVYVIDCLWNIGDMAKPEFSSRVTTLIETIRKAHPRTPILFVGQSQIHTRQQTSQMERLQEQVVADLTRSGVPGLSLCAGKILLGTDEDGTVDGVHPNDLGFRRHADALAPILTKLLRN